MQKISKENRERALNPQHPYKKGRQGYARLVDDMVSMCINILYKMVKLCFNFYFNLSYCT
jgi:hypothetical protein